MDSEVVLFWLVVFSSAAGLLVTLRNFRSAVGWVAVNLLILTLALIGWLTGKATFIYAATAIWLVFVVLPGLLTRLLNARMLQQRFSAARRLARMISLLHPLDGCPEQVKIIRAQELEHRGEFEAAAKCLEPFRGTGSVIGLIGLATLYRITNQWEQMAAWEVEHVRELNGLPQLLPVLLRARGETGNVRGLIDLYDRRKNQIAKLNPAAARDSCRLMLFAFSGQRKAVERLLEGGLAIWPMTTKKLWLATTDLFGGQSDAAKQQLEALLPEADASTRRTIERRLKQMPIAPSPMDSFVESVIANATLEQAHDERFGAKPSLFSRQARATLVIILLNVGMFGAEILLGGSENPETLFRLGALYPPAVHAGQWWRIGAASFLHFGPLHLILNMVGLWVLGPFVEMALGARKFVLVYLLTGVGSMGIVMALASGTSGEQMTLGASGSVMGLVGATGALMLGGWLREKAVSAKRRLMGIVAIVVIQTVFDTVVPHISMAAHLSGAIIGFAVTLVLARRVGPPAETG
jgi:rhomboid protease GluP